MYHQRMILGEKGDITHMIIDIFIENHLFLLK